MFPLSLPSPSIHLSVVLWAPQPFPLHQAAFGTSKGLGQVVLFYFPPPRDLARRLPHHLTDSAKMKGKWLTYWNTSLLWDICIWTIITIANTYISFDVGQALLSVFYNTNHLTLTKTLWKRDSNYPHFTVNETEAQNNLPKLTLLLSGGEGIQTAVVQAHAVP